MSVPAARLAAVTADSGTSGPGTANSGTTGPGTANPGTTGPSAAGPGPSGHRTTAPGTAGDDGWTIGAVASAVGITVRTLHHWDAVGLVRPSARSASGHRRYSAGDLARIHRVLLYRELGLPLDRIGHLLDAPRSDPGGSLREQRAQLADRITRLQGMVEGVDRLLAAIDAGALLTPEEQVSIFGQDWQPSWIGEAQERWGDTDQWAQYAERAATMTPQDWQSVADTSAALNQDLAAAVHAGLDPAGPEAAVLAERHRASIGAYFTCTHAMQVCLGRMYEADPDFTAYYERLAPGLTRWLREAIDANAVSNGVDPATATWQ